VVGRVGGRASESTWVVRKGRSGPDYRSMKNVSLPNLGKRSVAKMKKGKKRIVVGCAGRVRCVGVRRSARGRDWDFGLRREPARKGRGRQLVSQ
jgi:hypothetical protein